MHITKRLNYGFALLLAATLTACSDEQSDGKKSQTENQSVEPAITQNSRQNGAAKPMNSLPGLGLNTELGSDARVMRILKERGINGEGPRGILDHRRGLLKGQKPLSDEELKKNQEIAAKRREQQLADARKNIDSKDEALRLQAVSHLDTYDANDLALLENALMADPSSEIREEAAVQLSDGDPKVTVPALLNALGDHEPDVAIAAIESLSGIDVNDKSAIVAAIKNISTTHQNEDVREAAESALENMN